MKTNFAALDFIVLAAYLIGTTLLGVWLGRNQKDSKDYFVAGHAIPWWAVLFSVVATETSALTFISIPVLASRGLAPLGLFCEGAERPSTGSHPAAARGVEPQGISEGAHREPYRGLF